MGLGKWVCNPASNYDDYLNYNNDHYNHNNSRSDYNIGHANNCAKYYVPNDDSADNYSANHDTSNHVYSGLIK